MPFGREASGLTRVFEFGARRPGDGLPQMLDEMRRRNELWNALVELERAHRPKVQALIRGPLDDQIDSCREQLRALRKNLKAMRAKAAYTVIEYGYLAHTLEELCREWRALISSKEFLEHAPPKYHQIPVLLFEDPDSLEKIHQQVKHIAARMKPIYDAAKEERKRRAEEHKDELDELEVLRRIAVKEATAKSGAHWMNSEEVVQSYEQNRTKRELHFHSWTMEGKISVRYQNGRDVTTLFDAEDMRLRVKPIDTIAAWTGTCSQRRKSNYTEVSIRCGSDKRGHPVWVRFTAYLHRPLPEGSMIRGASIISRRVGLRYEYRLLLNVRCMEANASRNQREIRVDLDWKRCDDGSLQVASWRDTGTNDARTNGDTVTSGNSENGNSGNSGTSGDSGAVVLPARMIHAFESLDSLRATYKEYQNNAMEAIALIDRASASTPDWFRDETAYLAHWESPRKFMRLWWLWKDQPFDGDEQAFAALDTFRERWLHLYPWECNLRDQVQRDRREMYRVFAADVAAKYGRISIDDRSLISKGDGQFAKNIRKWTRIAAASILRNILRNTAAREGLVICNGESSQPNGAQDEPQDGSQDELQEAAAL